MRQRPLNSPSSITWFYIVDLCSSVRFCEIRSLKSRRILYDACARSLCDQWGGDRFFSLVWGSNFIPKSLIDSGFQDTPKSIGFKPCEGSVHKVIFWGVLRYFRKWFSCSPILSLLFAIKITKNILFIFEKSFKYIVVFLRGKSLLQGPVGEMKKVVFGAHPEG